MPWASDLIRYHGLRVVAPCKLRHKRPKANPIEPVFDSFVVILAGFLLLIPGLLTGAAGLLLLVPPVRRRAINWATSGLFATSEGTGSQAKRGGRSTVIIEGTYERLDDTPRKPEKDE